MTSLRGKLLVASARLVDSRFSQTVVLLLEHGEEGALGLILNRPTDKLLRDVWERLGFENCVSDGALFYGGPVDGPLMALHGCADVGGPEPLSGLFLSSERTDLERLVAQIEHPFRLYAGYAGWGAGQLENEIAEDSWDIAPADPELVLMSDPSLWTALQRALFGERFINELGIRNIPADPRLN